MGLDTTHDAFHGPYSSFHRFRSGIAAAIGFDLNKTKSYGGTYHYPPKVKEIGLLPFFDHSDCDGELSPEECKGIAAGLEEVIKTLPEPEEPWDLKPTAERFRNGCLLAYSKNESIEFG